MPYKQLKLWFDRELAKLLASKISKLTPDFDSAKFIYNIDQGVQNLELKDRVELIADELNCSLRGNFVQKIDPLLKILGPENEEETGMFKKYYWIMPIAKFIEKYGLDDFDLSMVAIEEITKRNTGEYTIRPFIEKYPHRTMKQMFDWSMNPNVHVRRLASEGGRPRLPWATKLQQFIEDPSPLLPILEALKDDESKFVQKSVANCLNDVLKDNPDIAKELVDSWSVNPTPQRKWIINHALRILKKKNDVWALETITNLK